LLLLNADDIGIYAVLGVFILGVAMPRGLVARELQHKLEPMTTNFLLPLFFVYSGLNTRIGLVNTPVLWGITLVIILAACLGKGVAYWAVARWKRRTPARCAGDWRPDELLGNRLKAYVVPLEGNGLNVEDVEMPAASACRATWSRRASSCVTRCPRPPAGRWIGRSWRAWPGPAVKAVRLNSIG